MSIPSPAGVPGATGPASATRLPSSGGASSPAGLPAIDQASEPEWVRHGSASTQKAYETALSFEATLVEQLSKSFTSTSGLGGEGAGEGEGSEEGADAGSGELSSLLPQALTGGVMRAGGLGLAAQMAHRLEGAQSSAHPHLTGGTAATGATAGTTAAPAAGAPREPAAVPVTGPAPAIAEASAAKTGGTAA